VHDVVVIGGGIVGLATALAVTEAQRGADVLVLEKADAVGTGQTGHNSGVIHAGIYYAPGSLKARLCRAGEVATKEFCDEHEVPYATLGKLVVATDPAELERMRALAGRAAANGVEVREVGAAELRELEPDVTGVGALLSPRTAVVDFAAVCRALATELILRGVVVRTGTQVTGIREHPDRVEVDTPGGAVVARRVVACAGLQADRVARAAGLAPQVRIVPFRGEYHQLPPERAGLVRHLVYPVPDPALPFLGVHLNPTVDGRIMVGPNAVLSLAREGYHRGSVDAGDLRELASYGGTWRMAARQWRTGLAELRDSWWRRGYLRRVQRYCPSLTLDDLRAHEPGIRAQAVRPDGSLVDDFEILTTARQVHVLNAPSPAATSALPIGREVVARLGLPAV
jgi:L-2-hydroxyglutarate oxidase